MLADEHIGELGTVGVRYDAAYFHFHSFLAQGNLCIPFSRHPTRRARQGSPFHSPNTGPVGVRGVSPFQLASVSGLRGLYHLMEGYGKSFIPELLGGHSVVGPLRYKIARKIPEI